LHTDPKEITLRGSVLVLAIAALLVGIVVGTQIGAAQTPGSAGQNTLCQDALARRAQAQQALARGSGSLESDILAHRNARSFLSQADADIAQYCRPNAR
jgi:hypothetical protein